MYIYVIYLHQEIALNSLNPISHMKGTVKRDKK